MGWVLSMLASGNWDQSLPEFLIEYKYLAFGALCLFVTGLIASDPSQDLEKWAIIENGLHQPVVAASSDLGPGHETELKKFSERALLEGLQLVSIRVRYHDSLHCFAFGIQPNKMAFLYVLSVLAVTGGASFTLLQNFS
ncbi:MAG: hypothetical protein DWQ01_10215 [Planctomycetota bacterium]|nr:MAG: hypothetical protein DWQ01_10215 [Planctomycetota bacterium]